MHSLTTLIWIPAEVAEFQDLQSDEELLQLLRAAKIEALVLEDSPPPESTGFCNHTAEAAQG